ncbi:MAG: hypothetical protein JJE51_11340 [Thermoanaerobaculia bacterium]|nr:hypothetical protein [Thermoanaerobaculia bacterium]
MNRNTLFLVVLALVALMATPSFAQSSSVVEFHGFGGWALGKTDGLKYSFGTQEGQYDNAEMAINASARPMEQLSIVSQIRFDSNSQRGGADLDYAFAEWAFSDAAKIRMGRVKHPFGIYGEVFDVGTLRPFYSLPASLYGANGFTARAYNGAGLTGNLSRGRWGLQYDLYAGQIEGDFEAPGLLTATSANFAEPNIRFSYRVEDTVGGRLNISTPIDGLTVGGSGYSGEAFTDLDNVSTARRDVYAAHVEFIRSSLTIRSEYGHLKNGTDFSADASYVELSYRLREKWQLSARLDSQDVSVNVNPANLPKIFPQLLENKEKALGLSYWFTPGLVVRASWHHIDGNRFAFPERSEDVLRALQTGELDRTTDMLVVGAQFSF